MTLNKIVRIAPRAAPLAAFQAACACVRSMALRSPTEPATDRRICRCARRNCNCRRSVYATVTLSANCAARRDKTCKRRCAPLRQIENKMRKILTTGAVLASTIASIAPARPQQVPRLDVEPVCHGIAAHAPSPGEVGGPDLSLRQCVNSELAVRRRLVAQWGTFSAASKAECLGEATAGGLSSYTDLLTCLQLSRDARRLR